MSIIRPWNIVWTVLFLLAVFVLAMPTGAYGAKGADDPGSYGAWGKDPRRGASAGVTLDPFNSKTKEVVSFSCIVRSQRLSDAEVSALAEIGRMGTLVYRGAVDENKMGGKDEKDSKDMTLWGQPNFGHPAGAAGLKQFIKEEKKWLNKTLSSFTTEDEDKLQAREDAVTNAGGNPNQASGGGNKKPKKNKAPKAGNTNVCSQAVNKAWKRAHPGKKFPGCKRANKWWDKKIQSLWESGPSPGWEGALPQLTPGLGATIQQKKWKKMWQRYCRNDPFFWGCENARKPAKDITGPPPRLPRRGLKGSLPSGIETALRNIPVSSSKNIPATTFLNNNSPYISDSFIWSDIREKYSSEGLLVGTDPFLSGNPFSTTPGISGGGAGGAGGSLLGGGDYEKARKIQWSQYYLQQYRKYRKDYYLGRSAWSSYNNRQFQGSRDGSDTWQKDSDGDKMTDRRPWSRDISGGGNIYLWMDKGKYIKDNIIQAEQGFPLTAKEGKRVARLLNSNPISLSTIYDKELPDGCIPAVFDNQAGMKNFGDLFSNPVSFIASVILAPVIDISDSIYRKISADAWGRLFYTAHTERGDLVWDLQTDCLAPDPISSGATSEDRVAYRRTQAQIRDSCQGTQPLGFSKKNTNNNVKDRPLYLNLASLVAWLITGTYFVILFAAAVVFIYRGNKSQKFNLMKVAPRILLSMMIAIAAPFLIGALITVSNWATVGILEIMRNSGSPISSMNLMLSQAGDMMGTDSEIARLFITAVVSVVALATSLIFFAGALIKQLALIFLIILAPVAIFCLIVDSWRPKFMRWLKSLFVIVLLPVVLATLLMLAVLLNPIMAGSVDETLGIIMLLATLIAMGWVFKTGLSIAIRGKNTNFLGGLVTAAGAGLQMAAPALNAIPGVGSAAAIGAGVAGQGLRAGGQRLNRGDLGDKMAGALIPEGRSSGGAGGAGMLQNMGRSITHGVHIGQGRRGVFGRTGRYGRAGKKYDSHGGGGEEGEGKEKTPRNNPAARTYRKMKRSIGRAKAYPMNRLRERRTLRAKRRMEQGKGWDWVRPLTRPKSLDTQLAGAGAIIGASSMLSATQYRDENGNIHNYHATETLDAPTTEKMEKVAKDMERDGKKSFKDEEIQRRWDAIERNPNLSRSEKRKARKQVKFDVSFEMNREGSALNEKWKAEQAKILENINAETAKISPTGRGLSAGSASIAKIHGGQSVVQTFDGAQYATNKEKTKGDAERRRREAAARAKQSIPPGFSGEKTTPSGIITPDSHTNH